MTKFIEVHLSGVSYLINLAYVEEIKCDTDGRCVIYAGQDYIVPEETYDQIKNKILGGE